MATSTGTENAANKAATIKFFNMNMTSDAMSSDSSDEDSLDEHGKDHSSRHDTSALADSGDQERSIYDAFDSSSEIQEMDRPKSRSDSDSNLLIDEYDDGKNEYLVMDMTEDHFSLPEDLSSLQDILREIEKLKQAIYVTTDDNPKKGELIEKLISLRIRQSELDVDQLNSPEPTAKQVCGHEFRLCESTSESENRCEVCTALVWGVIHSWYTCMLCSICCHEKCLNSLKRMCASTRVNETSGYSNSICPDRGLSSQGYKCYECQVPISYKSGATEPRQCDYTGYYYCPSCHWNDTAVVPARVVHNWDFEPRKVCRASRQYLKLMYKKPVISLSNSRLLSMVEELNEIKKLREEILLMKVYFLSCQSAMQNKLLLHLEDRQHFVENSDVYTMYDLIELVNETLLPRMIKVHSAFSSHIKVDCVTCRGKGYFCEVCNKSEVLFPFDNICISCPDCHNVFHKYCFLKVLSTCPRCERKRKREAESLRKARLLEQIELSS